MSDTIDFTDDGLIYYPDGDADYNVEPRYLTSKDANGTTHVEVEEGWSQFVILEPDKTGKFQIVYDSHKVVF